MRLALTVATTIALAIAGGALFDLAGVPVAWLSGSMTVVAAAAVLRVPVHVPKRVTGPIFAFLGLTIGAGVTPDTLALIALWPGSMVGLAIAVPAMMAAGHLWFIRNGWDRKSAFFAASPGALTYVIALASDYGADLRRVALSQSLRLLVLVALLPVLIVETMTDGAPSSMPAATSAGVANGPIGADLGLAILFAASFVGGFAFVRLGVPSGMMTGAMTVSGILHLTGLVTVGLPAWLVDAGLVSVGALMGCRFVGTRLVEILLTLKASLGALAAATLVCAVFSIAVALVLGLPAGQVLLAFAPGGTEAMTILAFALDLDPAYVAVHHIARFIGLAIVLPFAASRMLGRR